MRTVPTLLADITVLVRKDLLEMVARVQVLYCNNNNNNNDNRIYNKILDRDWFSARLFVTYSARDHVDVQLQVSDLNFL